MENLVKEGSIGAVLHRSGIISQEDIRSALEEQRASGCRFGEALVRLGVVKQEDIDWALSNQLDIPYVRLSEEIIDRAATELVPAKLARKYNLIPIIRSGDELHIALADPLNKAAVAEVEELTGCRVIVSMPIIRELREMLDLFYGSAGAASFGFVSSAFSTGILEKINDDTSGARLLEYLVLFFLQNGIASLSLQPAGGSVHVSARRGRTFREVGRFPVGSYPELVFCIRKLTGINGSREPSCEGSLVFRYRESDLVFRVFTLKALEGECITFKMDPAFSFPAGLGELGLSPEQEARFRALSAPGSGVVLFSSPERGERCRFLDLFLEEGETANRNVMLLGEGIGKGSKHFPRIPLQEGSERELEAAVSALLEHDPDLIAMEDATGGRSFQAAWNAAMRGRLVAAGISLGGLPAALDFLIHERLGNRSVAVGVRAVVAFTGVRTLCPHCREAGAMPGEVTDLPAAAEYYRAAGCQACGWSGYGGKRYLLDILPFDQSFREAFSHARNGSELLHTLAEAGYCGAAAQLADFLKDGVISPEEYAAVTNQ